jgi:MFS family permease
MGQPTAEVAERRSPAGAESAARHPALALTALLGAMFLANVDVAIANVAAPSIKAGLHAGGGELELVVSGYTLAYAVLLVTSARLGEARGYRRVFLAGLGAFTVASAACGLAPDTPFLIAARIAAGAAAALMAAQVLTGISGGSADGPGRGPSACTRWRCRSARWPGRARAACSSRPTSSAAPGGRRSW